MLLSRQTKDFRLTVEIDSSDTLFNLKIEASFPEAAAIESALRARALERKVFQAFSLSAREVFGSPTLVQESALFTLKSLLKKFKGSDLAKTELSAVDPSELVCRCVCLDRPSLIKAFEQEKGDYKNALLKTNATLICSSCALDARKVFESLNFEEMKRGRELLRLKAQSALDEFPLHSPPEFEGMTFQVASLNGDALKIKALNRSSGLGRSQILKTLKNYLPSDVVKEFKISIFF